MGTDASVPAEVDAFVAEADAGAEDMSLPEVNCLELGQSFQFAIPSTEGFDACSTVDDCVVEGLPLDCGTSTFFGCYAVVAADQADAYLAAVEDAGAPTCEEAAGASCDYSPGCIFPSIYCEEGRCVGRD